MGGGDEGGVARVWDGGQLVVFGRVGGDGLGFWSWVSFIFIIDFGPDCFCGSQFSNLCWLTDHTGFSRL